MDFLAKSDKNTSNTTVRADLLSVLLLLWGGALVLWHTEVRGFIVLELSQEPDRKCRKKLCTYIWHASTLVKFAHGLQRLEWPTPFPVSSSSAIILFVRVVLYNNELNPTSLCHLAEQPSTKSQKHRGAMSCVAPTEDNQNQERDYTVLNI